MIPYFQIPSLPLFGSFAIHPFGVLVAIAILFGAFMTLKRAKQLGLDEEMVRNMIFWTVFTGFIFAHVLDVVFYYNEPWGTKRLLALIDPRSGLSSMGGFSGAVFGLIVWCRRNKQKIMPYADSLAYGLSFGWVFGRLGCYTAHDHPGLPAPGFPLAVAYPCPVPQCNPIVGHYVITSSHSPIFPRHDLGFYEACIAAGIAIVFFVAARFRPRTGFFVALIALLYGPIRFFLDFLREIPKRGGDTRFAGLTPAQYAAIGVALIGIYLCIQVFNAPAKAQKRKTSSQ